MLRRLVSASILAAGVLCEVSEVTFFIKQPKSQRAHLLDVALKVSDPTSDRYGQFLSFEEIQELQRPVPGHLEKLLNHLEQVGVSRDQCQVTSAGDKVVAKVDNSLLQPRKVELDAILDGMVVSRHGKGDATKVSRSPQRLSSAEKIKEAAVEGGPRDDPQACMSPLNGVGPECLRKAYGVGTLVATHPKNSQAVIVNEGFNQADVQSFLSQYHLQGQDVKLIGQSAAAGNEGSLDVEYISAMGSGVPTTWVYIDGHADNPFASWLTYMSNHKDIPLVQSLSVGAAENEVGEELVARMNAEMAALGARGVTILFASGDSGYQPAQKFGAASPFVTAVGGVWRGEMGSDPFLSVDEISTGGFSSLNSNPIQSWQKKAVESYLKTKGGRPDGFNSSRRCVPDIAAYDDSLTIIKNGASSTLSGTSCAAPVVAGMLSLINDALLQAGHSPLGFANPFLYANEGAFLDIVHGSNGGPGGGRGFDAVPGYDPASGLGTFGTETFAKLKKAAIAAKEAAASKRASKKIANEIVV